ncbi:hypothetical protein KB559_18680 [Paenibacillus sp. Marseille-P2973]|uniref:hypothetical protein n=1 Tax=Paenibacillus sp. Marseille-P2973 TaxID=1871032 RepID=UPI001B38B773|nr:hypothetical protein [Paenibacillus sp. Marseille-P2973]MBQ4900868.1 hypothetical protein [Paenibacillus sp. Marseille-P2973]
MHAAGPATAAASEPGLASGDPALPTPGCRQGGCTGSRASSTPAPSSRSPARTSGLLSNCRSSSRLSKPPGEYAGSTTVQTGTSSFP